MKKWISVLVIAVLTIGIITGGYFLWQQTNKLGEAESEIVTLEADLADLREDISYQQTINLLLTAELRRLADIEIE